MSGTQLLPWRNCSPPDRSRTVRERRYLYRQFYDAQGKKAAEYLGPAGEPAAEARAAALREQIEVSKGLIRQGRMLAEQGYELEKVPYVVQYNKRDLPNAAPLDEMRRLLNPTNVADYEACATVGKGVFETLKSVAKGVLTDLRKMGK